MEKHLGLSQGFKQLVKEQNARSTSKKGSRTPGDELKSLEKSRGRNEKILQSINSSISSKLMPNDIRTVLRKDDIDALIKKDQKRTKSTIKVPNDFEEKIFDVAKRNILNGKTTRLTNSQNFIEKYGSGEGCLRSKLSNEKVRKNRCKRNSDLQKSNYISDDNEDANLYLQNNYLKSIVMNSDLDDDTESDSDIKEITKQTNSTVISPRTIFTKSSYDAFNEFESKPQKKNKNEKISRATNSANLNVKSSTSENKNDDSEESGMSYLMKKYLQASDEAARKFSESARISQFMKNSSTQANIGENSEKGPVRMKKSVSSINSPKSSNIRTTRNIISKLHSFKRT
ncbi:PREDICTED: uncharacterized protein LOC105367468 [Ceratosolen solmsi marchali]|uniref:Uncharacterized protein LOC105367468 n=1 Tax=Ceratosolen solmsi marchali TaxID=326594 RepID=A0AAJ7E1L4_9HYME|nr:PREDICTED: uncharacterized protein LOC105367468 [Ceratosolen solmsi marchali]